MIVKPYVGQKVKLSKRGYQSCHLASEEEFEQAKNLTITAVMRLDPDVYDIRVDQPLINALMLCQAFIEERT